MTATEMSALGWSELDILVITGDAYVDHPSFGSAIIARALNGMGFRVGVLAQPDHRSVKSFTVLGRPRYGIMVGAGNLDSMLSNRSDRHHRRKKDAYAPDGEPGHRPDRATIVYCNRVREAFGDIPLVIGGIEASLRRLAHYDWWADDVRRSILVDSRADLLVYGMGELQTREIARRLADGEDARGMTGIAGTCYKTHAIPDDAVVLPSFNRVRTDMRAYAEAFRMSYREQSFASGARIAQDQGAWIVVCEPPARPMTTRELDEVYAMPFTREPHPSYAPKQIPALSEVKFSITSHRGCFGECAFCAITSHQGRVIQQRSVESIVKEARMIAAMPDFKGYIHDLGGPTANFRIPQCERAMIHGACRERSCLYPRPCKSLIADHSDYIAALKAVENVPGVKKVFIRSGIRYDYLLHARDGGAFLKKLCADHVSGQLKIAPEHVSERVLAVMRKCGAEVMDGFIKRYDAENRRLGKRQYVVPYFMSAHPGSTLADALVLAEHIRDSKMRPEQVQSFTPTPGSLSTCIWYTGIDPYTGEDVYVARDEEERQMQRALLQYWMPQYHKIVIKALRRLGRHDLIGTGSKCLVRGERQGR